MTPQEFIRKWKDHALTERAAAQEHFLDLCRLFDHPKPAQADPKGEEFTFEKGAAITGGGDGWADVWKKGYFAWEYKKRRRNLDEAMVQLTRYAAALEHPPLLVVCDTIHFQIVTTWTNLETKKYEFELEDLADPDKFKSLRAVFHDPDALKPTRTRAQLTKDAADKFQTISDALQQRNPDREAVAHFVNQLVFCFFADSVKLLPEGLLRKLLNAAEKRPQKAKDYLDRLFGDMETGGDFDLSEIYWFNGGLFDGRRALPLERVEIQLLFAASSLDWSLIDPTIFGTLFERFLDPDKRAQIGAHYTDADKIMLIVEPVVLRPLRREWEELKARIEAIMAPAKEARPVGRAHQHEQRKRIDAARARAALLRDDYIESLASLRILDPACGSGNFLYLALQGVKDIELRAVNDCEALGLDRPTLIRVGPEILHGIEINPFAAELARTTIWIGDIQWAIRNAIYKLPEPILRKLDSIECRDAVLAPDGREAEWPEADYIVGNPPFLGGKLLRKGLGDDYVEALFAAYDGLAPAEADLVCYWFAKAWRALQAGKVQRVGLVSTNSIRGGANRRVLEPIAEAGAIFEAWSDEPWTIDGAAVRVSLVCFGAPQGPHAEEAAQQPSRCTRAEDSEDRPHAEEAAQQPSRSTRAEGAQEGPHAEEAAEQPSRSTRAGAAISSPDPHAEERLKGASRSKRASAAISSPDPHAEERLKGASRSTQTGAATSSFETPAAPAPQDEVAGCRLDGVAVATINADLTGQTTDLTTSKGLPENHGVCFQGPVKVGPFDIEGKIARSWLAMPSNPNRHMNQDVLRPWANGMDIVRRPSDKWIIDFDELSETEAAFFQAPFEYVKRVIKPLRDANRDDQRRRNWWKLGRSGGDLRAAMNPLVRCIITPRVSKHRLFVWGTNKLFPDSAVVAIARDDDTTFGILHSRFHEAWSLRLCTWLGVGNDPRYTPTTTFETFPFPEGLTPNIPARQYAKDPRAKRIAAAAKQFDELRRNWLNPPDLVEIVPEVVPGYPDRILPKDTQAAALLKTRTLTNLYNERPQWLVNAHAELDKAVASAYGWPEDIATEDALAKLLELNLQRSSATKAQDKLMS